ncbi:MAG: putative transport system permease protein [Bryobacterales bacterium]|jgi:putative ABC transport system permease protein|nr:putative transport system permease protein [Bryobacterales bacterium]
MQYREAFSFSFQALSQNPVRSLLTGLGMMIGTASVILVVTISLTSQSYILEQIEGVGSNMIFASFEVGSQQSSAEVNADFVKMADIQAVREQLGSRIVAATGIESNIDSMFINGREERLLVIGSDEHYKPVRNLVVLSGRFLDSSDVSLRQKVALLTEKLAKRLYGSQSAAIGQFIKIHGLQFTIIGTFKEKVESFGQSELNAETVLIPITVMQYFIRVERIDPMYVQVRSPQDVEPVTLQVKQLLESRHRAGTNYKVENLTGILNAAKDISKILSMVLVLVSAIALIISGIGIMNIMLVTVTERTREIGVRMAVGASRREIMLQFLTEAILISLTGGCVGIAAGVAVPLSVQFFVPSIHIPISLWSIGIAFAVSSLVGLIFGMLPASRASKLNPTEALRYE